MPRSTSQLSRSKRMMPELPAPVVSLTRLRTHPIRTCSSSHDLSIHLGGQCSTTWCCLLLSLVAHIRCEALPFPPNSVRQNDTGRPQGHRYPLMSFTGLAKSTRGRGRMSTVSGSASLLPSFTIAAVTFVCLACWVEKTRSRNMCKSIQGASATVLPRLQATTYDSKTKI